MSREKTFVFLLAAITLILFSTPVLAAVAAKCCQKMHMGCDTSNNSINCCEKNCYPVIVEAEKTKPSAFRVQYNDFRLSSAREPGTPIMVNERKISFSPAGIVYSSHHPLYSLYSAYLI